MLTYLFHRVEGRLYGRPTLLIIDEGWLVLDDPTFGAQLREWLKTLRKKNASVVFATQSLAEIETSAIAPAIVESCPTKLLLANPALDRRHYAELFQLNEMELDLLTGLIPRQQILLKRPDLAKVLTLAVDPKSYWIYTNTPIDNARVAETFREYGFEAGLDRLAASA